MYGPALQGNPKNNLAYVVGKDIALETRQQLTEVEETPFVMVRESDGYTFIPEQMMMGGKFLLNTHEGIISDGFYEMQLKDSVFHVFAYNYNRGESSRDFYSKSELEDALSSSAVSNFVVLDPELTAPGDVVKALQKESELWKLFIIFALLFLLVEVLILRLWK